MSKIKEDAKDFLLRKGYKDLFKPKIFDSKYTVVSGVNPSGKFDNSRSFAYFYVSDIPLSKSALIQIAKDGPTNKSVLFTNIEPDRLRDRNVGSYSDIDGKFSLFMPGGVKYSLQIFKIKNTNGLYEIDYSLNGKGAFRVEDSVDFKINQLNKQLLKDPKNTIIKTRIKLLQKQK